MNQLIHIDLEAADRQVRARLAEGFATARERAEDSADQELIDVQERGIELTVAATLWGMREHTHDSNVDSRLQTIANIVVCFLRGLENNSGIPTELAAAALFKVVKDDLRSNARAVRIRGSFPVTVGGNA